MSEACGGNGYSDTTLYLIKALSLFLFPTFHNIHRVTCTSGIVALFIELMGNVLYDKGIVVCGRREIATRDGNTL